MTTRRLSQAIAEGAGISLLLEVGSRSPQDAAALGAEGLVVRSGIAVAGETELPVLAYASGPDEAAAAGADAVVVAASTEDDDLLAAAERAAELGIELVVRADDEDDVARVLESLDPEIFLLAAAEPDGDEGHLAQLLDLLPDVPAGKLAIAELVEATREEIEELERAGIDAVVVAGDLAELSGDSVPDV
ncbi:MAG: hypothetical protein U0R50_10955 [Gaiellales bacterium]